MSKDRTDYLLNIEEVLGPKLREKLPRFAVNFLKRRIHEEEINDCIMKAEHYCGARFFDEALKYVDITYKVRGAENLDPTRKYIFACNHPLGGPEALIIGSLFYHIYGGGFKVPSNQLLMNMKPLAEFFTPVKVQSKSGQGRDISAKIAAMFESDEQVLVFPAGLCARKIKGKVTEMPWKKMFVTQARKYERDVVPVHISGSNSAKYHFFSWISRVLGLKMNIAMLFLVDELFNKRGTEFTITIGKPIPYTHFDSSKTDIQWAAEVKNMVEELSKDNGCPPNM
ncbi:MAG: 1-acyl-sn-glycerol-3-phosphate acyltransferase [Bacteroidales bacterium]|nr:1-acyl-sn-glycerol-3-phosphate acyltransferase [Bacteroidales bacterium]MBR5862431.1 1-acyl-sn-glycerol-3-phosphate acyltransferase [Bacteroidales bacterium]